MHSFNKNFTVGNDRVGEGAPVYFIAEIGANFDNDLETAKRYAKAAKDAGAQCAKIQSFKASKIVSRAGFASMTLKGVHGSWNRPVDEVFAEAEFPREWHKEFFDYCRSIGITPATAAYDFEAVDLVTSLGADFYKIGSGDITWLEMLAYTAKKGKPIFLATGAATWEEVQEAVATIEKTGNKNLVLMQCITNYPSKVESANINVLKTYAREFELPVGYSDHSPGDVVVMGSVALGAKVIEKHVTFDRNNKGPDHPHSMTMEEFAAMIAKVRQLEAALGSEKKEVVEEESETVIVQRRGLTATRDLSAGSVLVDGDIEELRPALGIPPKHKRELYGKTLARARKAGEPIRWEDIAQ